MTKKQDLIIIFVPLAFIFSVLFEPDIFLFRYLHCFLSALMFSHKLVCTPQKDCQGNLLRPQIDYLGNLLRPWMVYMGKLGPHFLMEQNGPVHLTTSQNGMDAIVSCTAIHCNVFTRYEVSKE